MALRGFGARGRRRAGRRSCCCSRGRSRTRHRASTRPRSASRSAPTSTCRRSCASTPGRAAAGWAMWGLVVAAAVPLFVATGDRLAWTARGWLLALVGWAVVWVPARFFPDTSVLAPEAGLTLAALGLALCVGIAVSVFVDGIHSFQFGWRQPAVIVGAFAIVLPALLFTGDVRRRPLARPVSELGQRRSRSPRRSAAKGEFRMLWVGDPSVLPARSGGAARRHRVHAHPQRARRRHRAVARARARRRPRRRPGGRVSPPPGSPTGSAGCSRRWASATSWCPSTQGRDGGATAPVPRARARRRWPSSSTWRSCGRPPGIVLYENLAYAPDRRSLGDAAAWRAGRTRRARTVAALAHRPLATRPLLGSRPVPRAPCCGVRRTTRSGTRRAAATRCATSEAFGWANRFRSTAAATVSIAYAAQWQRWAMLAGALVLWLLVVWRWRRTRVRRDPARRAAATRQRRERAERHDPLADVLDEDAFWWERV